MMRKAFEAVGVLALSVLTVTTTMTYIHNQSKAHHPLLGLGEAEHSIAAHLTAKQGAVKVPVEAHRNTTVKSGVTGPAATAPVPLSGVPATARSTNTGTTATSSSGTTTGSALVNGWSQADVQRFLSITQTFFSSMTPEDWQRLQAALEQGSDKTAETTVMSVASEYLSPSDLNWLASHLSGSHGFGTVDIELLKQTLAQLKSELTPAEQQLLSQSLSSLAGQQG